MKVTFIGFTEGGRRESHRDWALQLEPETEFEESFINAVWNLREPDACLLSLKGKLGFLIAGRKLQREKGGGLVPEVEGGDANAGNNT